MAAAYACMKAPMAKHRIWLAANIVKAPLRYFGCAAARVRSSNRGSWYSILAAAPELPSAHHRPHFVARNSCWRLTMRPACDQRPKPMPCGGVVASWPAWPARRAGVIQEAAEATTREAGGEEIVALFSSGHWPKSSAWRRRSVSSGEVTCA